MIRPPKALMPPLALAALPLCAQVDPKVNFNLFGDVRYVGRDTARPAQSRGQLGQLDFIATGSLNDRFSAFAEVVAEYDEATRRTGVDLERFYVAYAFDDQFSLGLGKRHIPLGYWNNAFHHGAVFQPTIDRPQLVEFEDGGGLQPAHDTGLWFTARNLGPTKAGFEVMTSNGQTGNQAQDGNQHKALTVHVDTRVWGPVVLGVSYRSDLLAANTPLNARDGVVPLDTDLTMAGADLRIEHTQVTFLSEWLRIQEKDAVGKATSTAWFAFLGVKWAEAWTPYALIAKSDLDPLTRVYGGGFAQSTEQQLLGLKYDFQGTVNLKVEVGRNKLTRSGQTQDKVQVALAFGF